MIQVVIGGVLAIVGGLLASCVNALYQRRYMAAKEVAQRERMDIEKRDKAYYEFMAFLNQFLQFLHPSIGEDEKDKYTAGQSLVEYVSALTHAGAGVILYGSEVVASLSQAFFGLYNEVIEKDHKIDLEKFNQLYTLAAKIMTQMRAEITGLKAGNVNVSMSTDDDNRNEVIGKGVPAIVRGWGQVVMAVATVITCCIAGCELNSSAKTWRKVAEMFMATERQIFCIERVARLAVDGKNFNHEDCRISNIGDAPRCYLEREIKEYLVMNFSGSKVPHWVRKVVVPIQFYRYGVVAQGLKGVIYEKRGECARLDAFEHYNRARDFFATHGIGYYDSVDILAHVRYVDRFGKEIDCYYKCDSGGQRELTEKEYEQYAIDAQEYAENPVPLKFDKLVLEDVLKNWVLPELPIKSRPFQ